jgi:hypothetical protein
MHKISFSCLPQLHDQVSLSAIYMHLNHLLLGFEELQLSESDMERTRNQLSIRLFDYYDIYGP